MAVSEDNIDSNQHGTYTPPTYVGGVLVIREQKVLVGY